ncbi:MAG TPA: PAC2 family protein [Chitinispirillaceae bacterium]|nr:PAC2 family protein [Chitinispirillaceae bacterium]
MKIFKQIQFESSPAVLASWPGMGNVGLITVDYLRRKLNAAPFAEIDMSPFFIPDSILVKNGIADFPQIPSSTFYYTHNPNLIIFESNAQINGKEGIMVTKMILDIILQFQINQIFTFAAFAQPISHRSKSQILVTCNSAKMLEKMTAQGLNPMPDGFIAGQNGLLLGVAASRQIDSACILGTIPGYALNLDYPKSSFEQIKAISNILKFNIDLSELMESVDTMAQQYELIEERIKEFIPAIDKDNHDEISEIEDEKVPHYVMEKIEKLFLQALKDRSLASELKKELDRWNLFDVYENRFLNLFE